MRRALFNKFRPYMKKFLTLIFTICLLSSCGPRYSGANGEKTQKDAEKEFLSSLTDESKREVLQMAEYFMEKLKNGPLEDAVNMIYVLHDNVIYQKSEEYKHELILRFSVMPVIDYSLDYFNFSTQGNNDICYTTKMSNEENAPTIKLTLNPVLVDGKWYLTFKDGSQSSMALPEDKQIHELAPAPTEITLNK